METDNPLALGVETEKSVPLMSLHTHTNLSLCGRPEMSFEAVVEIAERLGFFMVGLSDHVHVPEITRYPRHLERLREYKALRDASSSSVRIVVGGEFEVAEPGRIIGSDELIEVCEYRIVAPNHYHLDWVSMPEGDEKEMARRELDNIQTILDWPYAHVVAHPFAATGLPFTPDVLYEACDKVRLRDLFQQAKERGIAFEIQPKFWCDPWNAGRLAEFFETWLEMGGQVSLGSDAHTLAGLEAWKRYFGEIVRRFELTVEEVWWPGKST